MRWIRSFRFRILMLVVVGGVVPVGLIGFWITGSASRAGEQIVRERLDATLSASVDEIAVRWTAARSGLITLGESEAIQEALRSSSALRVPLEKPAELSNIGMLTLRDASGTIVDTVFVPDANVLQGVRISLPVYDGQSSRVIGSMEGALSIQDILASTPSRFSPYRYILTAIDPVSGLLLMPMPFSTMLLEKNAFEWGGDEWVADRRILTEPSVVLVAAAPLSPLSAPFEAAAARGIRWLLVVAAAAIVLAVLLTGRMTRSLARLSLAAEAVSRGDLQRRVELPGNDEIGRVATAFNTMTENLQRVMRQLADRQALAAVGEFAASLSHEIRNALTAIRLDMQVVGESIPDDPVVRTPHERALGEVERLNETVSNALKIARSGKVAHARIDLWVALQAAVHAALPEFEARAVALIVPESGEPIYVSGDAASMEQLFLNILLNAAQATPPGGEARLTVETTDTDVLIQVVDTGAGISEDIREKIFEPFYSTREDGTGLGLPIARRIAQAHGGQLRVSSVNGRGTTVEVQIPRQANDVTK